MNGKTLFSNALHESNSSSLWKIKGIGGKRRKHQADKRFSVTEFLNENGKRLEEAVVGPGGGIGVGCGVGVGLGMVGGVGVGGSMWNHLKMVFGIGIGCGVGVGFGYGQGFGIGITLDDLRSRLFPPKRKSKRLF
ncbi:hypothetical protein ACH5RR_011666 [Cinchona calisaya]|uniref:Glycine-rich protein n=1 Tax=Cinchona calisaya TaxID=153742 RepID=A0ABD3A962_9GENT